MIKDLTFNQRVFVKLSYSLFFREFLNFLVTINGQHTMVFVSSFYFAFLVIFMMFGF
jgi:hypothetical protein